MHGHHAQPVGGRPSRARSTCDRPPSRQTSGTQSQRCRGSFLTVMGACVWCVWCGRGQSIYPIYWPIVSGYLTNSQHQLLVGLKTIFIHLLSVDCRLETADSSNKTRKRHSRSRLFAVSRLASISRSVSHSRCAVLWIRVCSVLSRTCRQTCLTKCHSSNVK